MYFQAAPIVFIDKDDQSSRWINDITAKNLLEPRSLSDLQGTWLFNKSSDCQYVT